MEKHHMKRKLYHFTITILFLLCLFTGCSGGETGNQKEGGTRFLDHAAKTDVSGQSIDSIQEVPEYEGQEYIAIHDNVPEFDEEDKEGKAYEYYSELDELGRCGVAQAKIGEELMPEEERGSISSVKPTGWHTAKYDSVDGKYLYNRCHLIGYQLTAENANKKNLITGTRSMNVDGMLPFENMVADYIKETGNHVLYRVTPVFEGDNLVASGVQMEAESVEDKGEGISFNVYVYNAQPGIAIDYKTGESEELEEGGAFAGGASKEESYILNISTKKYHLPSCKSIQDTRKENKKKYKGTAKDLLEQGYEPCKRCRP